MNASNFYDVKSDFEKIINASQKVKELMDAEGNWITIEIKKPSAEVAKWCFMNYGLYDDWFYDYRNGIPTFYFRYHDEAMRFKLIWC